MLYRGARSPAPAYLAIGFASNAGVGPLSLSSVQSWNRRLQSIRFARLKPARLARFNSGTSAYRRFLTTKNDSMFKKGRVTCGDTLLRRGRSAHDIDLKTSL